MRPDKPRREGTHSYLVRIWKEPRETAGGDEPVRLLIRDLSTGEEQYLSDPRRVVEILDRAAEAEAVPEAKADLAAG